MVVFGVSHKKINGGIHILNRGRESPTFITTLIGHRGDNIALLGNVDQVG